MKNQLWRKNNIYLILIGVCIGIILLVLLAITILDKMGKAEYINDNVAEGIILFICIPGIIIGIIGTIIRTFRKK
jgi:predicted Na+-dependent transporter